MISDIASPGPPLASLVPEPGVTFGEVMAGGEPPLLKKRKELTQEQAIKLWAQKRQAGWQACPPQWIPPHPDRPASMGITVITPCF